LVKASDFVQYYPVLEIWQDLELFSSAQLSGCLTDVTWVQIV